MLERISAMLRPEFGRVSLAAPSAMDLNLIRHAFDPVLDILRQPMQVAFADTQHARFTDRSSYQWFG